MKKICFITTVSGTIESFILDFAKYLKQKGDFDIYFICDPDEEFTKSLPNTIHYIPVKMKRGISFRGIGSMLKMFRIFKRENFELVQYSTPNASCYASIAAWMAKVPIRLYCQWGIVYVGFEGLKRTIFKLEEKMVCRLSTWIEPDSKSNLIFSHKEGLYPLNKGSVVWNGSACGVNLNKFDISRKDDYNRIIRDKYGIPYDAFIYGFVGRITKDKGINELFSVAKEIIDNHSNAWLLLIGNADKIESVDEKLYNWAHSCNRVVFAGYTHVVEQYIAAMNCYILPSYREGFGMSVVEAEAMGIPVIVTDIPGPIDAMVNRETGIVVKKQDVVSLKMAMLELLDSKEMCEYYGKNGAEFASEKFDQQIMFEEIHKDRLRLLGLLPY